MRYRAVCLRQRGFIATFVDTSAELECARETICRQETALIDKERDFCQKLEQARADDFCKIRQLRSEMYANHIHVYFVSLSGIAVGYLKLVRVFCEFLL